MVRKLSKFIILVILFDQQVWSQSKSSDFLKRWELNPQEVSKEIPHKKGSQYIIKLSKKDIRDEKYIDQKDEVKLEQCKLAGFENCVDSFNPFEFSHDVSRPMVVCV